MQTLESLNSLFTNADNMAMLGINRLSVDCWIDTGTIISGSNKIDENGLHFCDYEYQLALSIEGIHAHRGGLVLAMLHNWRNSLSEQTTANTSDPQIVTSSATKQNGGGKIVNVEYTVTVRDAIYLTESDTGPVVAMGRRWTFGDHAMGIAESISLTVGIR